MEGIFEVRMKSPSKTHGNVKIGPRNRFFMNWVVISGVPKGGGFVRGCFPKISSRGFHGFRGFRGVLEMLEPVACRKWFHGAHGCQCEKKSHPLRLQHLEIWDTTVSEILEMLSVKSPRCENPLPVPFFRSRLFTPCVVRGVINGVCQTVLFKEVH